jgi:hypothetical protein
VCSKGRREREVSGVFILFANIQQSREKSNDARKVFEKDAFEKNENLPCLAAVTIAFASCSACKSF